MINSEDFCFSWVLNPLSYLCNSTISVFGVFMFISVVGVLELFVQKVLSLFLFWGWFFYYMSIASTSSFNFEKVLRDLLLVKVLLQFLIDKPLWDDTLESCEETWDPLLLCFLSSHIFAINLGTFLVEPWTDLLHESFPGELFFLCKEWWIDVILFEAMILFFWQNSLIEFIASISVDFSFRILKNS